MAEKEFMMGVVPDLPARCAFMYLKNTSTTFAKPVIISFDLGVDGLVDSGILLKLCDNVGMDVTDNPNFQVFGDSGPLYIPSGRISYKIVIGTLQILKEDSYIIGYTPIFLEKDNVKPILEDWLKCIMTEEFERIKEFSTRLKERIQKQ